MSYDSFEISNYDSAPTNLYEFSIGYSFWRYAAGEEDVTIAGFEFVDGVLTPAQVTYKAVPISDSGLVQSGDTQNDDFTVTLPANVTFASLYLATPPSQTVYLTCRRKQREDNEAPVVWVGEVRSTKRSSVIELQVICKVLTATLNRNGLRLAWGRGCPHALYDRNCTVDPDDFGIAINVQGLTGASITSSGLASLPAGYLSGGYFEFDQLPGVKERRMIESHSGSVLNVLGTTDGLEVSDWITVFPGCDRVSSTCNSKFNNLSNYGGFSHMPGKSPFDGDPVF